jgi:hypothetical protein
MKEAQESLRKLLEAAADSSGEDNTETGFDSDFRNEMPDMTKAEAKMKEKIDSQ